MADFRQKISSLVVAAFLACVCIAAASEKESVCCKVVSTKRITVPITGFRLQPERPPCVKAVIFYTSEGAVCSHWKETWVKNKVVELRKLQAIEKSQKMATTTFASQTSGQKMATSTFASQTSGQKMATSTFAPQTSSEKMATTTSASQTSGSTYSSSNTSNN